MRRRPFKPYGFLKWKYISPFFTLSRLAYVYLQTDMHTHTHTRTHANTVNHTTKTNCLIETTTKIVVEFKTEHRKKLTVCVCVRVCFCSLSVVVRMVVTMDHRGYEFNIKLTKQTKTWRIYWKRWTAPTQWRNRTHTYMVFSLRVIKNCVFLLLQFTCGWRGCNVPHIKYCYRIFSLYLLKPTYKRSINQEIVSSICVFYCIFFFFFLFSHTHTHNS